MPAEAPSAVQRAEAAAALFAEIAVTGSVPLGALTDDEECVLGGDGWALGDPQTWREFAVRPHDHRTRVSRTVRRSLVESGQVWPSATSDEVELTPALGIIAAARTRADFFVVARTEPEQPRPVAIPLGYAVADDREGYRGLVVELRTPGWHDYRMLSGPRAAAGFVDWAMRATGSDEWGSRAEVVALEVLRFDEQAPTAAGLTVPAAGQPKELTFDGLRQSVPADRESLIESFTSIIDQAVSHGRGVRR